MCDLYYTNWDGSTWRKFPPPVLAQPKQADTRALRDQVLGALEDGQPRSLSVIQEQINRGYHNVRDTVRELMAGGQVERVDMGRAGIRYRVIR